MLRYFFANLGWSRNRGIEFWSRQYALWRAQTYRLTANWLVRWQMFHFSSFYYLSTMSQLGKYGLRIALTIMIKKLEWFLNFCYYYLILFWQSPWTPFEYNAASGGKRGDLLTGAFLKTNNFSNSDTPEFSNQRKVFKNGGCQDSSITSLRGH